MKNRSQLRGQIYDRLKFWDKKRADLLKHHKKSVEQIQQFLQKRINDSKQYINHLKSYLQCRINQLKIYTQNSVMNSQFVLQKNRTEAYQVHYDYLKQLVGIEANQQKQSQQKLQKLLAIHKSIKQFSQSQAQVQETQSANKLDGSSILLVRGNIKYLVQCQLQDIIQQVMELGQKVSEIYNKNDDKNDLYIAMLNFVHQTHKQAAKHRQIGRQLLNLASVTMKREIKIQQKIRQFLKKWSQVDGPIQSSIVQNMQSKNISQMVKHFYDLNQIADIQFEEPTIEDFLINFHINPFTDHERLKLCQIQGIYNKKIETMVIITADSFVHLLRMNNPKPDFSFCLNSQIEIQKTKQCCFLITQYKKWMLFKKEKEFQFQLQFMEEHNYLHFKDIAQKIGSCKIK